MNGAEVLTKFTADTTQVDKATKGLTNSFGSLTTAITLGNVAAQAIGRTLNAIADNMDAAISRIDTMNNFPKVMNNLGISSADAEKSLSVLKEKLKGLPTTLEDGAMAVQRFASISGDINEATNTFLAVNNAILAGGASAQIQASALEQLSQAYSKGKPDAQDWKSIMQAMPAQLKQVAKAMGYVSAADLGEAIKSKGGEAEFQRMIETIKRLNVEGGADFASFQEQAKDATGGIATSMKTMKQSFVSGVADIISKIDEGLSKFGGIAGVLTKIGSIGEQVFKAIGSAISFVLPYITSIVDWLSKHKEILTAILIPLGAFIAGFTLVSTLISTVIGIIGGLTTAFQVLFAIMNANPIGVIIGLIAALVATFTFLWNHCEEFKNFWIGLWDGIKNAFSFVVNGIKNGLQVLANFFSSVFGGIKSVAQGAWNFIGNGFKLAGNGIKSVFGGVKTALGNAFGSIGGLVKSPVNGVTKGVNGVIKTLNKMKVPDWVPGIGGKGINIPLIPQLATGTNYVPKDMLAQIHQGEAIIPKKFNPYVNPIRRNTVGSMLASSPGSNITIQNSMEFDALGQLVNNVKTFSGGAKNDYNYVGGY